MTAMTVAIVGGGPSGLASAKAMLDAGLFPRVFEATDTVGGLWSPKHGLCRPAMRTNLSKHTNCFSGLPWPDGTPAFPTATQVGEYLSCFVERYLSEGTLSFNCRVTSVERSDTTKKWIVKWSKEGNEEIGEFDFLVVACGFFSEPYMPSIPGLETFPGTVSHSSAYTSPGEFEDKHIAIVGGSLSSVEIVEDIASYTKSIHHIIPRPFWVVPKFLPLDHLDPGTAFLPLDLVLYRRQQPQTDAVESASERWKKTNEKLCSLCGDLSDISKEMKVDFDMPPYAAVSDMYANYLRSGRITLYTGHLSSIAGSALTLAPDKSPSIPDNVSHIIFATGFRPSSASSIFSESQLSALSFSSNDNFLPFLLHRSTLHPSFPNVGFVGYYRGPYWGIIELQARWLAGLFSGSLSWPSVDEMQKGIEAEDKIRNMRPRTQWPRGDYVGFGTELAETIGISLPSLSPVPGTQYPPSDNIFVPSLFNGLSNSVDRADLDDEHERNSLVRSLNQTISRSHELGLFVAAAIFRALHGPWKVSRTYDSRLREYPSGPSSGRAEFVPRKLTSIAGDTNSQSGIHNIEYVYSERTVLTASSGLQLQGTQQYVYRYDEPDDKLEVYFVKRDEQATLDYLFHKLDVQVQSKEDRARKHPWRATSCHFCSPDNYEVAYEFYFKGADLEKWKIKYEVRGPRKDYTMETWYVR